MTSKSAPTLFFFNILTWKCASRHNGVQFVKKLTSKSAPSMRCFVHFDLKICFAPQRVAIFQSANFRKCSELLVFFTFSLENVLCATKGCNFSFILCQLTSAPAALASLLFILWSRVPGSEGSRGSALYWSRAPGSEGGLFPKPL